MNSYFLIYVSLFKLNSLFYLNINLSLRDFNFNQNFRCFNLHFEIYNLYYFNNFTNKKNDVCYKNDYRKMEYFKNVFSEIHL
jgi:hypothetical protein